jgi:hypothetical protein
MQLQLISSLKIVQPMFYFLENYSTHVYINPLTFTSLNLLVRYSVCLVPLIEETKLIQELKHR